MTPSSSFDPTIQMGASSKDDDFEDEISQTAFDSPDVVDFETIQIGVDSDPDLLEEELTAAAPASIHARLTKGAAKSWGSTRERLLRSRLLAIALALTGLMFLATLVQYLVTGSFGMFFRSEHRSLIAELASVLRVLVCLAATIWLARPVHYELNHLRRIQYLLIGGFVIFTMLSQHYTNAQCVAYGETIRLALNQKNTTILLTILLLMYASLVPDSPRTMTRVILLITLWPFVTFAFTLDNPHPLIPDDQWETIRNAIYGNTLASIFAAGLAIYVSYALNHLRKELHEAQQLGQYRLGEKLGEGGMGEVYVAEHQFLKRPCALKTIRPAVGADPLALARFEREVQSTAILSHPNTIRIYDYGHSDDGTFYYVMEYLSGLSVAELIRDFGTLSPGRAVYLLRQAAQALIEAHQMGMIHRDLKPANLFVAVLGGECDFVKVLDYGLVKVTADPDVPQLTADFTVSGTPAYMSPEQATASSAVDSRADIYALGGVLYTMLTGRPPFTGANAIQMMIAHAKEPVVPPSQLAEGIPEDLEAVVLKCLAKNPDDRYPDARSLDRALAACNCAADWDVDKALDWWIEQAESRNNG